MAPTSITPNQQHQTQAAVIQRVISCMVKLLQNCSRVIHAAFLKLRTVLYGESKFAA